MRIKNPNLANSQLVTKEGAFAGDAHGVFDLPDNIAKALVATPGWTGVRAAAPIAPPAELAGAPQGAKKGGKASKAAEATSDASKGAEEASTGDSADTSKEG